MPDPYGSDSTDPDEVNDLIRAEYLQYQAVAARDLTAGDQYSTGHLFSGVTSGSSVNMLLQNPSDSGEYVLITTRFITTGLFYGHKSINVSVSDVGTAEDSQQRRSDMTNGDVSDVYHSATVDETNARKFTPKVVGSGGGGATVAGANVPTPEVLLAPGDNLYMEATNQSSNEQDITIDIDYTNVNKELVDSIPQT